MFSLFVRSIKVRSILCAPPFSAVENMDQSVNIEFCVKNGFNCFKTLEMLKVAYVESDLSQKNSYTWYKLFQENREDINDETRSGYPSTSTTSNVEEIKKIDLGNRRI